MKTNEELQGMTHDELVAYTQNLQRESEAWKSRVQVPFCQQTLKSKRYGKSNRKLGIDLARNEGR